MASWRQHDEGVSDVDRSWFESIAGGAPTVAVDEIVGLHFEEDWREYFEIADFHPLYLRHVAKVMLVTAPPEHALSVEYGRAILPDRQHSPCSGG